MNVLLVYKNIEFPVRGTIIDHLYSLYRYKGKANVFHLWLDKSMYFKKKFDIPRYLKRVKYDVIVFHYSFASSRRAKGNGWEEAINEVEYFKNSSALKVLFAQDEMYYTNQLNEFVTYYGINQIWTVAPESEWAKIYDRVDRSKVKMYKTLTGYFEANRHKENEKKFGKTERSIDIGYRARRLPPWYGRHGFKKTEIADVFNKALHNTSLVTDISTRNEDTLYGDDWERFLYRCKYMLGVESGASVLDPDGSIGDAGAEYIKTHPDYTFEEVEQKCFPGKDGQLKLFAISPRVFECCASKTCQVLIEGDYDGILKPDIHYIPIRKDFSNIEEVIKKLGDETLREKIVETAYNDIILSGKYSYKKFTEYFLETCSNSIPHKVKGFWLYYRILSIYNYYMDRFLWKAAYFKSRKNYYLSRWYLIDLIKKIKNNNKGIKFIYSTTKKIMP